MEKGNRSWLGIVPLLLLASPSAFAYLDPSTGSMVVSAIVGILASLGLALKTYWYKIKRFFKGGSDAPIDPDKTGADRTDTNQSAKD